MDVLEQIVDGVMAGMARTGRYEPRPLDPLLLQRAYDNTAKMLAEHVQVVDAYAVDSNDVKEKEEDK